jgi:hypothetical protein
MNNKLSPFGWALLGAGLMYVLDPGYGRRRRVLLRNKTVRYLRKISDAADATARDMTQRGYGLLKETQTVLIGDDTPDDVVLAQRVRAALGFVVSHPHAIEVTAHQGQVTLSGPILAQEHRALLDQIASVRGVQSVKDQLTVHERPDGAPSLQGGRTRRPPQFELLQNTWSPSARFATSIVGGALALAGLRRSDMSGRVLGIIGLGLLARGLTNQRLQELISLEHIRQAVEPMKSSTTPQSAPPSKPPTLH